MSKVVVHRYLILMFSLMLSAYGNNRADVIYINGNIWTGVPGAERKKAVAIKGDVILAVGSNQEIEEFKGEETRTIDLEGQFMVPGFADGHTHFMSGGFQLISIDLRDADSPEEFVYRIDRYVSGISTGTWVQGGDWDHELWGGELPHRSWIDSFTQDIPVFVSRLDGHMGLANLKALELAGITVNTPDPPGGMIVRDKNTGEPTGILKDGAISLVTAVIPEPSLEEMDNALERAMDFALSQGITQVHDMCSWSDLETYLRADSKGKLRVRIRAFPWYTNWERLIKYVKEHGTGTRWLYWGGMKAMMDGSLGSGTAWMYEPYLDNPTTTGILVAADTVKLRNILRKIDKAGIQLAVHAIGDKANDWLLDEFEEISNINGPRDRRFRIEHAQHLTPEAIKRFSHLNVTASMQPYHIIDDGKWAGKRVGPELLKTSYANRSLLDAGANLSFGSDWTVAPISPILGIYGAVTRRTLDDKNPHGWYPEQKITVGEALRAYTYGNAYASFQENELGTLEKDKLADFVVLSEDLFEIDPVDIQHVTILRTVVGGQDQYVAQ